MRRFPVTVIMASLLLPATALAAEATLYKSPTCGCCNAYADYLKTNGFEVNVVNRDDMASIKNDAGVPPHLNSCHTTVIGRYTVEGHVPVETIDKLLRRKPSTRGIALPGMPMGSPGMSGYKQEPFEVYYIGSAKSPRLFDRR